MELSVELSVVVYHKSILKSSQQAVKGMKNVCLKF